MSYKFKGPFIILDGDIVQIKKKPLPENPEIGYINLDEEDNTLKYYDNEKWVIFSHNTPIGSFDKYCFTDHNNSSNKYLKYIGDNNNSNEIPAIIPFSSKLIAITFISSVNKVTTDIEIWKSSEGDGNESTKVYTYEVINSRSCRKSNFENDIIFSPGDKIAVCIKDKGKKPNGVIVVLHTLVINYEESENQEEWDGNL